jgi:signal transduction histidine kinase
MKRIFFSFFGMLVLTTGILHFAFYPLANMAVNHYLRNQIDTYLRNLVEGDFYLLSTDLKMHPENQWPARIDAISKHFRFPIHIGKDSPMGLKTENHHALEKGQIVVKHQKNGTLFYQKIERKDWIMTLGPINEILGLAWVDSIIFVADILIIGLLTTIWALLFWRKLQTIVNAALAFGGGSLETRCKLPRRSALSPLADAFNGMADRIQSLINAQRELTHAVSHELRTPISRIRFSFELLENAAGVDEQKHYMAEIETDIEELEELVTESLTYACFDQGTFQIKWQADILAPWVEKVTQNTTKNHPHINACCNNNLTPPDRQVHMDTRLMNHAVVNLIQNAFLHARDRVEVTLTHDGENCVIYVDDDGPGIPQADRHRVLQAFTRLDTSRNRASGGFGLGLAIVHRVSAWHGGRIIVTDAPLGGARITISWPGFSAKKPPITMY